ncbi:unnamed protein product [Tilletia controversa]|nr:unnamed protein product [Tilletia controversa]
MRREGTGTDSMEYSLPEEMNDPDFDDSLSVIQDQKNYCGYRCIVGPTGVASDNLPDTVLKVLNELEPYYDSCSETVRVIAMTAVSILEKSERTKLLRLEGRRFVTKTLDVLKQVAAYEHTAGSDVRDLRGTVLSLGLDSLSNGIMSFSSIVDAHASATIVMRSQQRSVYKSEARECAELQGKVRTMICTLISKHHRMASFPQFPTMMPATSLPLIKNLFASKLDDLRSLPSTGEVNRELLSCTLNVCEIFSLDPRSAPEPDAGSAESVHRRALDKHRLAWADIGELQEFERQTYERLQALARMAPAFDSLPSQDVHLTLRSLAIHCAHVGEYDSAAWFGELLVTLYRQADVHAPTVTNKIVLANALGALSILLDAADWYLSGVRAVENAVEILRPLIKSDPSRCRAPMAALKAIHAELLSEFAAGEGRGTDVILMLRKACRIAEEALQLSHQLAKELPASSDLKAALARAFYVKAKAGRDMIQVLMRAHADSPLRCPDKLADLNLEPEQRTDSLPSCEVCDSRQNECWSKSYLHDRIRALNVDTINVFVVASQKSVDLYLELAKSVPNLYEPLLAKALLVKAQLQTCSSPRVANAFVEVAALYDQLSTRFPGLFDVPFRAAYTGLARQQRWENDLSGAVASYERVQKYPLKSLVVNFGFDESAPLSWTASTFLCVQLERYMDGWNVSNRTLHMFTDHQESGIYGPVMKGSLAVRGFCRWMLCKPQDGLEPCEKDLAVAVTLRAKEEDLDGRPDILGQSYCAVAWRGAVQSAAGKQSPALHNGELAVRLVRDSLSEADTMLFAERTLYPFHRVLPHVLVLLAGTLLALGRKDDALKNVEESLSLNKDGKQDGSTVKTALLLKARLLEESGDDAGAARTKAEAQTIPFQGFLHKMGCSQQAQT